MNWDAIGAIGEITGAAAVVSTLIILILQIRQSTKATLESNQLERAVAIDRHSESVARWRGRITENEDLSRSLDWHHSLDRSFQPKICKAGAGQAGFPG